jgi:hypothetical protein
LRFSASLASASSPALIASIARRSHSAALAASCSACLARRFSSAIETATCFLASMSWLAMSMTTWFSIFSGSSERLIRSFKFDLMRVARRAKIPISLALHSRPT